MDKRTRPGTVLLVGRMLILTGCGGKTTGIRSNPTIHNEWAWMSGSSNVNQPGSYGTQGTAASSNTPGARLVRHWTDNSGNLWLFGGYGYSSPTEKDLNDLWKYSSGQWTWVGGSNQAEQPGIYGTKGITSPSNIPGARYEAVSWTDPQGNFWLFGGLGIDSLGTRGNLNDLWKYSNGEWTWMAGLSTEADASLTYAQRAGVYGSQGVPDPTNTPGARVDAGSWTDPAGNLWLFGG